MDIVAQLSATIQSGPYRKTAVVLVQNRAPEDLLLGTDLQPHLGFQLLQKSGEGPVVKFLPQPEPEVKIADPSASDKGQQQPPVVRLLQAVHLPAHYARIVRARVDLPACEDTPMFKPTHDSLNQCSWEAEEGIVGVNDDLTTTLVLQNPGDFTVHLCEGDILGELQQVCEVSQGEGVKEMSDPVVGQVLVGRGDKEVRVENCTKF